MDENQLKSMWDQQEEFMHLLQQERDWPEFPVDITSKKGQQFLDSIMFHMMKEMFESGLHLQNVKSHRKTEIKEINRDAFIEELCDALHLFYELCIAAGISRDELFCAYMRKGEINVNRIMGN